MSTRCLAYLKVVLDFAFMLFIVYAVHYRLLDILLVDNVSLHPVFVWVVDLAVLFLFSVIIWVLNHGIISGKFSNKSILDSSLATALLALQYLVL